MKNPWIVILCGAMIVTIAMGIRQSFGLFLPQMSMDIGISRSDFGLTLAVQNLMFGLVQPFVGALADKHGAGRVALAGALLYALGLCAAALASSAFELHLGFGLLIGAAQSATTFVVILGAVGRVVPPERRSSAFGIVTAGGSLGQFLIVPLASQLLGASGYQQTLWIMAAMMAVTGLFAIGVAGKQAPQTGPTLATTGGDMTARLALREAAGHSGYWLLIAGFGVCGFHITFIATHLPAYLQDQGLGMAIGAKVLALVGLFNIFGSYVFGRLGDLLPQKYILAALYAVRSLVIAWFVLAPISEASALIFASAMGFLWLGTAPLTSGLISRIFGVQHLSMLYGITFLSHQIGSFFGSWAGGVIFDATGSYDLMWIMAVVLGVVAALLHLPIADRDLRAVAA